VGDLTKNKFEPYSITPNLQRVIDHFSQWKW